MNRRSLLKSVLPVAGASLFLPKIALAFDGQPALAVKSAISANHGHALTDFQPTDALLGLRMTRNSPPLVLNIQGQSSHPHEIELNHADLLSLFLDGEVIVVSRGGSHSHEVKIQLLVEEVGP